MLKECEQKGIIVAPFKPMPPLEKKGNEHEYMMFECLNKGIVQVPKIIYNWYVKTESKQVSLDNNRLYVDTVGNLHFTYLLEKDTQLGNEEGDNYKCGISNSINSIILGSPTNLQVIKAQSGPVKPVFQYSNDNVKAMLYTEAYVECFFSGYDPASTIKIPSIKWFDDASNEITRSSNPTKYAISDDGRRLTIKNVQETDEKNFYCQGINTVGQTDKKQVFLNVISPPIFMKENGAPKDITKPEHEDAIFYCSARSLSNENPPERPVWYINGLRSGPHNDPDKYLFSEDNKKMTIKKLSKLTDIQCVQCEVTNNYGTTWGDACLNVILGITLTNEPLMQQKIKKGDIVNLTVTATTDPSETLAYAWEFKNESYPEKPPFVLYNSQTKVAIINTSLLTQEEYDTIGGVYTRILSHGSDNKRVNMEVILTDGPVVGPVVSKGGIDMWIIGLIIGILFLIIVIIIIIFVVCRKKQEGDYNVDKKETGAGLDPEKELKEKGFDDYSRPTYDDYEYPEKKPRGELEYDDVPIGGDDESLAEYGDEADTHFNEDGSFIGVYQNNRGGKGQAKSTESTI
ncbi:hypothetical protein RRG08_023856 [Elysia crispata]|uniref:Ig-like domain-containing protein n=1 Tax=Elysia crispata TaxID=231223 RepID=A0AAE1AT69_9GAST|nr:hypothetical protein RRG08_023856 [Elysia crispata]